MFELMDTQAQNAVIKVVGVGGGGGNAVEHMVAQDIEGVDFICANTDAQALKKSNARTVLQLGGAVTKGLGAGANPDIGREAAIEDRDRIAELLDGADMVFITAGMGGGTGTGAAPVIAPDRAIEVPLPKMRAPRLEDLLQPAAGHAHVVNRVGIVPAQHFGLARPVAIELL